MFFLVSYLQPSSQIKPRSRDVSSVQSSGRSTKKEAGHRKIDSESIDLSSIIFAEKKSRAILHPFKLQAEGEQERKWRIQGICCLLHSMIISYSEGCSCQNPAFLIQNVSK
jgi:hypothetical protein